MGARISSMLRKAEKTLQNAGEESKEKESAAYGLLQSDPEWELLKTLANYDEAVSSAAAMMDPSILANYLYDLSKAFSRFYHDCPILQAETSSLSKARLDLSRAVLKVLKDAFSLVCIPFLEAM
jgi:arginyl-tRNA synthetase